MQKKKTQLTLPKTSSIIYNKYLLKFNKIRLTDSTVNLFSLSRWHHNNENRRREKCYTIDNAIRMEIIFLLCSLSILSISSA